jgi:hypothetical protein
MVRFYKKYLAGGRDPPRAADSGKTTAAVAASGTVTRGVEDTVVGQGDEFNLVRECVQSGNSPMKFRWDYVDFRV